MTPDQFNDTVNNFFSLTAFLAALGCALLYGVGSFRVWPRSLLGVAEIAMTGGIAAVLLVVVLRRYLGDYPGYAVVAFIVYLLLTLALIMRFVVILVERRNASVSLVFPLLKRKVDPVAKAKNQTVNPDSFAYTVKRYRKAIAGFIVPALVILGYAVTVGSDGGATVTAAEWIAAAIAALGTGSTVGAVNNAPVQPIDPDDPE